MESWPQQLSEEDLHVHMGWLLGLARQLVRDPSEAEEVAQETWLAAIRRPPQGELRPWLGRVCRNFARQRFRARTRQADREQRVAREELGLDPVEVVERAEVGRMLVDLVLGLREPYRQTLLMRYQEGLSIERIAKEQGLPRGTVRGRLSRALAMLRKDIRGGDGEGVPAGLVAFASSREMALSSAKAGGTVWGLGLAMGTTQKIAGAVALVLLVALAASPWSPSERGAAAPPDPAVPGIRLPGDPEAQQQRMVEGARSPMREGVAAGQQGLRARVLELDTEVGIEAVKLKLVRESEPDRVLRELRSDAQGYFTLPLDLGEAELLLCEAPGGWKLVAEASAWDLRDRPGEAIRLYLRRESSAPLRGRLVDEAGGRPLGHLTLRLIDGKTRSPLEDLESNAQGYFRSQEDYAEGEYLFGVMPSGGGFKDNAWYEHLPDGVIPIESRDIPLRVGATFRFDPLDPRELGGGEYRAQLRRGAKPAGGIAWDVSTRPIRSGEFPWVRFSYEEVDDHLVGLIGPWHLLVGSADGMSFGWQAVHQVRGLAPLPLVLNWTQTGVVSGRVLDPQGAAKDGVMLELKHSGVQVDPSESHQARSRSGGRFRFPFVRPGVYELGVGTYAGWDTDPLALRVEAGVEQGELLVQLRETLGAGRVSGRVRSASGNYHAAVEVEILGVGDQQASVLWEELGGEWVGRFEFSNVPEGRHPVTAHPSPLLLACSFSKSHVEAPSSDLELFLHDDQELVDVSFQALDADTEEPLERFEFAVRFAEKYSPTRSGIERSVPALEGLSLGREFVWFLRSPGYVPSWGTQADLVGSGSQRKIVAAMQVGWGARFQAVKASDGDALAGIRLLLDGVEVGRTNEAGVLDVSLAQRPKVLGVFDERLELAEGWSVDPASGHFDDEDWSSVYVPLKPKSQEE